ncbi:MAG: hypothetical protein K5912_03985 [Alphaproteobacteria bacterium]|nr:hypothetical protein [Alphaproteobacteria bacterium]
MKKTLLSALAGLAVIGSASAIPTPGDVKKNCESLIAKGTHVWVEKTQECVPIDPCEEPDDSYYSNKYCAAWLSLPNEETIRLWIDRYTQNVLKTKPKKIELARDPNKLKYSVTFVDFRVKTEDGGYFEISTKYDKNKKNEGCSSALRAAIRAYIIPESSYTGSKGFYYGYGSESEPSATGKERYTVRTPSKKICQDIIDFSDLLAGSTQGLRITNYTDTNNCEIECSGLY